MVARMSPPNSPRNSSVVVGSTVVGVFGGSFDPPHLGHVLLPAYLRALDRVDRLVVAPCADHPLGKRMSAFEDRVAWTRAAMAMHGTFVEVTELERELADLHGPPSHTLRLLEAVAQRHPEATVRLVVGSDIVSSGETKRWHRWDEIERRFSPLVVPRTGYAAEGVVLPEVSSSDLRRRIDERRWDEVARRVPATVLSLLRAKFEAPEHAPIWVIGRGHVGRHMIDWLRERGLATQGWSARGLADGSVELPAVSPRGVLLSVRDAELESVARALVGVLPRNVPVLHAAGARPSAEALEPLRSAGHPVGTLHPICSLRLERRWPSPLPRAGFGLEGDPPARAWAIELAGDQPWLDLQGLDARGRLAYHGACALVANHLSVLQATATDALAAQGHPRPVAQDILGRLMQSALDNLLALGIPRGITGPVVRGDTAAVRGHLEALPPQVAEIYEVLSRRLEAIVAATKTPE